MKNQEKPTNQVPQNKTETPKPTPQKTTETSKPNPQQQPTTQNGSEAENTQQRERQQEQKRDQRNPGAGKEHRIGDIDEPQTQGKDDDDDKIKDPDPTIPERRNDPVAGKGDDYSRTRNTPGKTESNAVGEFTETDDMERSSEELNRNRKKGDEEDETETSNISDEEQDEEEPGSFDPETEHKEAFNGERKNSPDERKNKNGL
jgi:hypothetical protein